MPLCTLILLHYCYILVHLDLIGLDACDQHERVGGFFLPETMPGQKELVEVETPLFDGHSGCILLLNAVEAAHLWLNCCVCTHNSGRHCVAHTITFLLAYLLSRPPALVRQLTMIQQCADRIQAGHY